MRPLEEVGLLVLSPGDGCVNVGRESGPVVLDVPGVTSGNGVLGQLPVLGALEDVVRLVSGAEDRVEAGVVAEVGVVHVGLGVVRAVGAGGGRPASRAHLAGLGTVESLK